jgi:hypothetical protein
LVLAVSRVGAFPVGCFIYVYLPNGI